jgi:RND superfamily putative drug exporter
VAGVTGPVAAESAQRDIIDRYLRWVEFCTVLAIALIVGARFRSVGAPLVTLACAGTAYLIANRTVAWTTRQMGLSLPADVGPVLVVLLLGVTTDYSVFFLSGMRAALGDGAQRIPAARQATAEYAPIILAAGLIVAAATGSLAVAANRWLRAFGPALGLTVLAAMAVSMTLAPALMSVFGGLLFRSSPARLRRPGGSRASRRDGARVPRRIPGQGVRTRMAQVAGSKPAALLVAAACIAGLLGLAAAAAGIARF